MTEVQRLLAEYREQHRTVGEADPRPFLAQVDGFDRAELATLIDRFLTQAAEPPFDAAAFARFQADKRRAATVERVLDDVTLRDLVRRASIKRTEFVRQLSVKLRLAGRDTQVRRRLRDLENGDAPIERIRPAVWNALGELLGEPAERVRRAAQNAASVVPEERTLVAFTRTGTDPQHEAVSPVAPNPIQLDVDSVFFET